MDVAARTILARIEWCQRKRALADTDLEGERWQAEADGLRDALLSRNMAGHYCGSRADVLDRYATGLCDGQLMLRVGRVMMEEGRHAGESVDGATESVAEETVGTV